MRARSDKERYAKLCTIVEEADEVHFWVEILEEMLIQNSDALMDLKNESLEIVKVMSHLRKNLSTKLNR